MTIAGTFTAEGGTATAPGGNGDDPCHWTQPALIEAVVVQENGRQLAILPLGTSAPGGELMIADRGALGAAPLAGARVLVALTRSGIPVALAPIPSGDQGQSPEICERPGLSEDSAVRAAETSSPKGIRACGTETIVVADLSGSPIVTVDRVARTVVIGGAAGDIVISAPEGRLALHGAKGVSITSDAEVDITGSRSLSLKGDAITATGGRIILMAEALTTIVDQMVVRGRQLVQWIEDRVSLTAGRLRVRARAEADLLAERTILKARKDVRIDGDRINIG